MCSQTSDKRYSLPEKWLFIVAYPVIAILIVHVGNDNPFLHLLTLPSYFSDLLLSLAGTYTLGFYWRRLYRKLARIHDLKVDVRFLKKALFQGIAIPVLFAMTIELIYLYILGINWAESSIFYLELPVVIMCCSTVNLTYLLFIVHKSQTSTAESDENNKNWLTKFHAYIGTKTVRINEHEIAYFMIRDRMTFLVTNSGQRYIYDDSLENLSKQVNPQTFYQLNRQFLVRRQSILSACQTKTRRLDIHLSPSPDQSVYVAKNKASGFLVWMKDE